MTPDVIPIVAGVVGIAVIVAVAKVALVPSSHLGVSVFRPYRGDPWPVGVQEDDDARFSWTRRATPVVDEPRDDDSLTHVAFRPPRPEPVTPGFEEIAAPDLDVQPLTRVDVHRGRR